MLATEVQADLRTSSAAFQRLVWPAIRAYCGGGSLVAIERADGEGPNGLAAFDVRGGCDYVQVSPDGVLFGIAARVQPVSERGYDTFTIRYARDSGAPTEFAKRVAAFGQIHLHPIWPRWTVQAYVSKDQPQRLLSVAVVSTIALFAHIKCGHEGTAWWMERTSNATFLCVAWDAMPSYWAPFIWREPRSEVR